MFLILEFLASIFWDGSFLFTNSVKHLKIPVGSTQVCPLFVANSLLHRVRSISKWWSRSTLSLLGRGTKCIGQIKDKPLCFLQVFWGVLQNKGIRINNLRRDWLKTPTSKTFSEAGSGNNKDIFQSVQFFTFRHWPWIQMDLPTLSRTFLNVHTSQIWAAKKLEDIVVVVGWK